MPDFKIIVERHQKWQVTVEAPSADHAIRFIEAQDEDPDGRGFGDIYAGNTLVEGFSVSDPVEDERKVYEKGQSREDQSGG